MKKWVVLWLVAAMMLSLCACGGNGEAPTKDNKAEIKEQAEIAFEKLNDAASLCMKYMDDIYGAWYYGIYKVSDSMDYYVIYDMSLETPHFSSSQLEGAKEKFMAVLDIDEDWLARMLKASWELCVSYIEIAIAEQGVYDTIDSDLEEARNILKELNNIYNDNTYYPELKEYFSAVNTYAEFFRSPSGNFAQLSGTIKDYETKINACQSDLDFLFD